MYNKPLKPLSAWLLRLTWQALLRSYPNYQPVFVNGKIISGSDRNCQDRWAAIKTVIATTGCRSVLDIGSAEGFYVLQAAKECGCVSLGVDADVRRLSIAYHQLIREKISSAGFIYGVVDPNFLAKLPRYDLVIFMSVLHHIMYSQGIETSREILRAIKAVTGKAMIFEMGQSNEIKSKWSKDLPDMGSDPHQWIKEFILDCGYSKVEKIAESDSYQKETKRAIFKVEP